MIEYCIARSDFYHSLYGLSKHNPSALILIGAG